MMFSVVFFASGAQTYDDNTVNIGNLDSFRPSEPPATEIQFPDDVFTLPDPTEVLPLPAEQDSLPEAPSTITELPVDTFSDEVFLQQPLTGLAADISALLNGYHGSINWQGIDNKIKSAPAVIALYEAFNYQPLWTDSGRVTDLAEQVIKATLASTEHALRPEAYHSNATSSLVAGTVVAEPEKFDIILSDAFITYQHHLANGIVDPKKQFDTWNTPIKIVDFVAQYNKAQEQGSVQGIFQVDNKAYLALQQAYLDELKKPVAKYYEKIPTQRTLRPGMQNKAVAKLKARLDLPLENNRYDTVLKTAVRDYQKQHGLTPDGLAGRKTLQHLNKRAGNHLEKLAINMERHRWTQIPTGNYLWVNIPAFQMAVKNDNQTLFQSNVIVGRSERPTPVFRDRLENIVLAPYWNVPKTIFREDKLPLLQKDPHALSKTMQVIEKSSGRVVSPDTVDWQTGGEGYRLRQLPGPHNALGRMKFLFPNRHAIYLHDTPNKRLFKRSQRAYSSGCVRVERADDLALFLLNDNGYNESRIKKESRTTKEKWISLKNSKQYPVLLNYYTAWADDSGKVHYESDIYHYDNPLIKLYKQALNN